MLKPRTAKLVKTVFTVLIIAVALYTAAHSYNYYRVSSAVAEQRQRLAEIQQEQDRIYADQQAQYQLDMAEWRAAQQRITAANQQRVERWNRNPVIRERRIVQRTNQELAVVEAQIPLTEEPTGGSGEPLPPPPAPAPMIVEPEPQYITVERPRPQPQLEAVPEPPKPPTRITVSSDAVEVILNEDTSWRTIAQLLVLILGLYGGIRIINKYTRSEEAEPA